MTKKILINTIDEEESRMAIIEDDKLTEFNIQMAVREPIIGNIYKGVVQKVERGLQAAFVEYGGNKNGFLPLGDVSSEYFNKNETPKGKSRASDRYNLKAGQELLVQVVREEKDRKGAMLTTYLSLPGRYIVLMPNKRSTGISRKIESDSDRKRLRDIMDNISEKDVLGFIVRTAGMNRTKHELLRDYQILIRLWKDIKKKAEKAAAPVIIYQESDFAIRSLRDYYTSDVGEILVDDIEAYRKMRAYFKAVSPRNIKIIKHYREDTPIFTKYRVEDHIDEIYHERVSLKSGGNLVITPTEALITIDVNSGKSKGKRDVEETAFKTNLEAAEEIARQLRLRDLGGLIVIDFIDMMDHKHNSQVEKTFKKSLKHDKARIQLSKISKFGLLELSRQKKQSAIQEISYNACPHCQGSGMRPSIEYIALGTYRKIKSEAVKGIYSAINVTLPYEISDYLLNRKRGDMSKVENLFNVTIHISGSSDMLWGETNVELVKQEINDKLPPQNNVAEAKKPEPREADRRTSREADRRTSRETDRRSPRKTAAGQVKKETNDKAPPQGNAAEAKKPEPGEAEKKTPRKTAPRGRRPYRRRKPRQDARPADKENADAEKKGMSQEQIRTDAMTMRENYVNEVNGATDAEKLKEKKKWRMSFFDLFKS